MRNKFLWCLAAILLHANLQGDSLPASDFPDEFQIRQQPSMRVFRLEEKGSSLGVVLNSGYGKFDFYDADKIHLCCNSMDRLLDGSGKLLSFIEWRKDPEAEKWFWQRRRVFYTPKTHLVLFSGESIPLMTVDEEGEGGAFVFREAETGEAFAFAILSWEGIGKSSIGSWDTYLHHWDVFLTNRSLIKEKQIPPLYLVWALLKHSQLYFPSPEDYRFVKRP